MAYDDVVLQLGEFGRYQCRILLILCLPAICCGIHKISGVFLSAEADFRCLLPHENPENVTYQLPPDVANISYEWDRNTENWSQCDRYDIDLVGQPHGLGGNISSAPSTVKCDSFVYDRSVYTLTATTEWNLVCANAWLRSTSNAVYMVGEMVGSLLIGGLSDRYGRRMTFVSTLILQLLGGVLVALSPDYTWYIIFRFIVGLASSGVFLITYVVAFEMVGPKQRLAVGTICELFMWLGSMLIVGLAYFITNWRILEIAITIPSFTFIVYRWFTPESARWLLSRGHVEQAKDILQKAALENGVKLSQSSLDDLSNDNGRATSSVELPSVLDLLRYPNLRRKSLLLFFVWFVTSVSYFGLIFNSSNFTGNEYVYNGITVAIEAPAYFFVLFTMDKWGRKIIVCGCTLLTGAALLFTSLVPTDMPWLLLALAILGKWAITSTYGAIFVFTTEQYPTGIRNFGLGACSTSAKAGAILAPYVGLLAELWTHFPFVLLGSCSLIAGLLSLLLPETLNRRLPETIEEGEEFGKSVSKSKSDLKKSNDCDTVRSSTASEVELHV